MITNIPRYVWGARGRQRRVAVWWVCGLLILKMIIRIERTRQWTTVWVSEKLKNREIQRKRERERERDRERRRDEKRQRNRMKNIRKGGNLSLSKDQPQITLWPSSLPLQHTFLQILIHLYRKKELSPPQQPHGPKEFYLRVEYRCEKKNIKYDVKKM